MPGGERGLPGISDDDSKHILRFGYISIIFVLAFINYIQCSRERRSHYFMNDQESSDAIKNENLLGQPEYHDCFIIVQETKRIGGQCVKIRDKIHGCVAGKFMHPLHHDCL